jgi:hypothetical protein
MSFFIPAEIASAVNTGALPPDTGYYPVEIIKFEDRNVLDRQGNYSYFIHLKFPDGSTTREIGSCPFNAEGVMAPALAALSEDARKAKIGGMVGALKRVALSAGITEDYMAEHGLSTDYLVGREAYIAWLGRPSDTPKGVKAYGTPKAFILKEAYEAHEAKGEKPEDHREFPWRRAAAAAPAAGSTKPMPAPPKRNGFPPPPRG